MESVLSAVWEFLNSPAGITMIVSAVLLLANKLNATQTALWKKWEGSIITAVKAAEKAIPDDIDNKGLRRLNNALTYVLSVYEVANERTATEAEIRDLREGIQIVHAKLEAAEALGGGKTNAAPPEINL